MKKTHQIGFMTALLAGLAFATPTRDTVQSVSSPTASGAAFATFDAYNWIFDDSAQGDPGSDLKTLGVEIAFSFGM